MDTRKKFATVMNQSLQYAQTHSAEVRELLPAASHDIRLPIWTTLADRQQILELALYTKKFGVITSLPNLTQFVPSSISGGSTLQGTVGAQFITLRQDGKVINVDEGREVHVRRLRRFEQAELQPRRARSVQEHRYPVRRPDDVDVTLKKGTYTYYSSGRPAAKRTLKVT